MAERYGPSLARPGHGTRRKGAETTNRLKRIRREIFEDDKLDRALSAMYAAEERRRAKRHDRYLRNRVAGTLHSANPSEFQRVARARPNRDDRDAAAPSAKGPSSIAHHLPPQRPDPVAVSLVEALERGPQVMASLRGATGYTSHTIIGALLRRPDLFETVPERHIETWRLKG